MKPRELRTCKDAADYLGLSDYRSVERIMSAAGQAVKYVYLRGGKPTPLFTIEQLEQVKAAATKEADV